VDVPILAIGGITLETAADVIAAGATAPAVISAIVAAPDIATAASAFRARVMEAKGLEGSRNGPNKGPHIA
jgi:thiamine-phosphate pyrophosphorylase